MTNDHKKLQDLMDRIEGQPNFGGWTSPKDMADQVMAVYDAQGLSVDRERVEDFSLDVFKGTSRLPLKLPQPYSTPKEDNWGVVAGLGVGLCFLGIVGFIVAMLAAGLFGDRIPLQTPWFKTISDVLMCMNTVGVGAIGVGMGFQPLPKEAKRRSEETMRKLLDSSSTSAIEDLLRHPDRTPEVEALAWEELRRRKLRAGCAHDDDLPPFLQGPDA